MGAILTKVLRKYDLKLVAGCSLALVLLGSQQHRIQAALGLLRSRLEQNAAYTRLQGFLAKTPGPAEVVEWSKLTIVVLLFPVALSMLHSSRVIGGDLDDRSIQAAKTECQKRFKELEEMTRLGWQENESLLTGLLEKKNAGFQISPNPTLRHSTMPARTPLESRMPCARIKVQVAKANSAQPNDIRTCHGLLVASAALCYELGYVHLETQRWHLGATQQQHDEPKIEKYRSGKELQQCVEKTAVHVEKLLRDFVAPDAAAARALALAEEMVQTHEHEAFVLLRTLHRQKLGKSMKVLKYCTPSMATFIALETVMVTTSSALRVYKWKYTQGILTAVMTMATQATGGKGGGVTSPDFNTCLRGILAMETVDTMLLMLSNKFKELGSSQLAFQIRMELFRAVLAQDVETFDSGPNENYYIRMFMHSERYLLMLIGIPMGLLTTLVTLVSTAGVLCSTSPQLFVKMGGAMWAFKIVKSFGAAVLNELRLKLTHQIHDPSYMWYAGIYKPWVRTLRSLSRERAEISLYEQNQMMQQRTSVAHNLVAALEMPFNYVVNQGWEMFKLVVIGQHVMSGFLPSCLSFVSFLRVLLSLRPFPFFIPSLPPPPFLHQGKSRRVSSIRSVSS
jgi:hypothetical protein